MHRLDEKIVPKISQGSKEIVKGSQEKISKKYARLHRSREQKSVDGV